LNMTLPGIAQYGVTGQSLATGTEVAVTLLITPTANQGTLTYSYTVANGTFTNNTGSQKTYIVSWTQFHAGATGGRRMGYIRTTTGSIPAPVGTPLDETNDSNIAFGYQVAVDASVIRLTGCSPITLPNGGSFTLYAFQDQGSPRLCTSRMTILCL
jgi:hypothetical protein